MLYLHNLGRTSRHSLPVTHLHRFHLPLDHSLHHHSHHTDRLLTSKVVSRTAILLWDLHRLPMVVISSILTNAVMIAGDIAGEADVIDQEDSSIQSGQEILVGQDGEGDGEEVGTVVRRLTKVIGEDPLKDGIDELVCYTSIIVFRVLYRL